MATTYGLDMSDLMVMNVDKLRKRYPDGFSLEASLAKADEKPEAKDPSTYTHYEPLALDAAKVTDEFVNAITLGKGQPLQGTWVDETPKPDLTNGDIRDDLARITSQHGNGVYAVREGVAVPEQTEETFGLGRGQKEIDDFLRTKALEPPMRMDSYNGMRTSNFSLDVREEEPGFGAYFRKHFPAGTILISDGTSQLRAFVPGPVVSEAINSQLAQEIIELTSQDNEERFDEVDDFDCDKDEDEEPVPSTLAISPLGYRPRKGELWVTDGNGSAMPYVANDEVRSFLHDDDQEKADDGS
jgi:hypothetical protein